MKSESIYNDENLHTHHELEQKIEEWLKKEGIHMRSPKAKLERALTPAPVHKTNKKEYVLSSSLYMRRKLRTKSIERNSSELN